MSIKIQYSGRLADKNRQAGLIDDLIKLCTLFKWQFETVEPEGNDLAHPPVFGLFFMPHKKCEIVAFLFDKTGSLVHISALAAYAPQLDEQKIVSVATENATPDVHVMVIKILRFVQKKYMADLEVVDETNYWAMQDRSLLEHLFRVSNSGGEPVPTQRVPTGNWRPSESGKMQTALLDDALAALLAGKELSSLKDKRSKKDITDWDVSLN